MRSCSVVDVGSTLTNRPLIGGGAPYPSVSDAHILTTVACLDTVLTHRVGLPHSAMEDDEYRGYHIPGKTMVIANLWYSRSFTSISEQLLTFNLRA